ncbi:MAG: PAS domain-containing sensor histidine kinase [Balneolaceae bacterium]
MNKPDYERIIESATEYAIFTMDTGRRINFWNTGSERLFGWSEQEAIDRLADIIFPEDERPDAVLREIERVRENGSATDERWHVRKDGSRFWALGRMMSMSDDTGTVIGYVKILLDQTQRKQYEEQLQSINKTLEERVEERTEDLLSYQRKLRSLASELNKAEEHERQRLAGDLHDNLGQILAMCRMELELVQKQLPDGEGVPDIRNALEMLDEAIRYTRELMTDLKPPVGLDEEELKTMMEWLAGRMRKHGLNVTIEADSSSKPISKESRVVFLQSARELLFNVIKHAGVNEAKMELTRLDSTVRLVVRDNGSGFDPRSVELAQSDAGGFGLFNIRERLDLLGGSLDIDSEPGKGTAMTITAPLKK